MTRMTLRVLVLTTLVLGLSRLSFAQEQETQERWTLYESFSGSTNSAGQVLKLDTSAGYNLGKHFEIGGGLPLYFVRGSSSTSLEPRRPAINRKDSVPAALLWIGTTTLQRRSRASRRTRMPESPIRFRTRDFSSGHSLPWAWSVISRAEPIFPWRDSSESAVPLT